MGAGLRRAAQPGARPQGGMAAPRPAPAGSAGLSGADPALRNGISPGLPHLANRDALGLCHPAASGCDAGGPGSPVDPAGWARGCAAVRRRSRRPCPTPLRLPQPPGGRRAAPCPLPPSRHRWPAVAVAGAPPAWLCTLAALLGCGAAAGSDDQPAGRPADPGGAATAASGRTGGPQPGGAAEPAGGQPPVAPPPPSGLLPDPGGARRHRSRRGDPGLQRGLCGHHRLPGGGAGGPQSPHLELRLPVKGVLCRPLGAAARQRPLGRGDLEPTPQR